MDEAKEMVEAVPQHTRWVVSLMTGPMIGALVLAVFGVSDFSAGVAAAAALGTAWATAYSLRRRERFVRRTLLSAILPPTILFVPTLIGVVPAAIAGTITGAALLPLVDQIQRDPLGWRRPTLLWAAIAATLTLVVALRWLR